MDDERGAGPMMPGPPTEPIRPRQTGPEPIPERARHPIVVPRRVATIAGFPRTLVIAAVVALVVALVVGFLVGRASDREPGAAGQEKVGRRGACGKALTLALGLTELQSQALANRSLATRALAVEDLAQVQELNAELEGLSAAIGEAEAQLTAAVERCRSGKGDARGKKGRRGDLGGG